MSPSPRARCATWQTDACRALRALLEQPHVMELMNEQEGPKKMTVEASTVRVVEVLRAESLPDRPAGMDKVDPFAPRACVLPAWEKRCLKM